MALPELLANSPIPGQDAPLTSVSGNGGSISAVATSMNVAGAAPAPLQGPGQFRIIWGDGTGEIALVTAGANGTAWTMTRGVEGSIAAIHADGARIYHRPTAGALDARYPHVGTDGTIGTDGGTAIGATLDQIPGAAADVSLHSHKLTAVGDATAATDALNRETGDLRYDAIGAAAAAQAASDPSGSAAAAQAASLQKTQNLADVANAGTARGNLGLGSAATHPSTDFDAAGAAAAAQAASDPSGSATTAQGRAMAIALAIGG